MPLQKPARYTVTSALIYANGPIHIGHLAGCYLPADIYVRYLRAQKRDVTAGSIIMPTANSVPSA